MDETADGQHHQHQHQSNLLQNHTENNIYYHHHVDDDDEDNNTTSSAKHEQRQRHSKVKEYKEILLLLEKHKCAMDDERRRLSQLSQKRRNNELKLIIPESKCSVCSTKLNLEDKADYIICGSCNQTICRQRPCAIWIQKKDSWNCKLCNSFMRGSQSACDWLLQQLNQRFANPSLDDGLSGGDERQHIEWNKKNDTLFVPTEQRDIVREYIEEIVASMIGGGSLDNVPIGQLYKDLECLPRGENENLDDSYANLRSLVERIIEQVYKIPQLLDQSGVPGRPSERPPEFDPKKYEELLATAVLNKVVEKFEQEQRERSLRRGSSGEVDKNHNAWTATKKHLESPTGGSSSDEPRSDASSTTERPMSLHTTNLSANLSATNFGYESIPHSPTSDEEYLSDYIQNHRVPLPALNSDDSADDAIADDEYQSIMSNGTESDWQENWLFKKKKGNDGATMSTSSIAMLVPSPTEEVKALIGDRTADETSDLSEAGSDDESELSDHDVDDDDDADGNRSSLDIPHILVESKTIIGGKNEVESFAQPKTVDELVHSDSLISYSSGSISPLVMEAKNEILLVNINSEGETTKIELKPMFSQESQNESIDTEIVYDGKSNNISLDKQKLDEPKTGNEQDMEKKVEVNYTASDAIVSNESLERNAANDLVDLAELVPVPAPRSKGPSEDDPKTENPFFDTRQLNEDGDLPGSIAEREHKKWKNAQDIPNNPYSAEALQKRLSSSSQTKGVDVRSLTAKLEHNEDKSPSPDIGKPLQIVLGGGKPDFMRYGRDYYINDAKNATGSRKKISDWYTTPPSTATTPTSDYYISKLESPLYSDSEIYTAKPVLIQDDKLSPHRTSAEDLSIQQHDSLTPSEDSDTTRVYDLHERKTSLLRSDITKKSQFPLPSVAATPPSSPIDIDVELDFGSRKHYLDESAAIQQLSQFKRDIESRTSPLPLVQPIARPSTAFVAVPKARIISTFPFRKMDQDIETINENEQNVPIESAPPIPRASSDQYISLIEKPTNGKTIIEEEVLPVLPSVKALAKNFIEKQVSVDEPQQINRPKIKFRKSLNWHLNRDNGNGINSDGEYNAVTSHQYEHSQDTGFPPYNRTYHPVAPGHSITARSLSTKFREELKNSISEPNLSTASESSPTRGHASPERPSSPVLVPGILKSNIAFFENLKNKK